MIYLQTGLQTAKVREISPNETPFNELLKTIVQRYDGDKDSVKKWQAGYFFSGEIKKDPTGKLIRNDEAAVYRDLIIIDVENTGLTNSELIERITRLNEYNYYLYPSINHTEKEPRYRLVLEPDRNIVSKEEYETNINAIMQIADVKYDPSSAVWSQIQGLPIARKGDPYNTVKNTNAKKWQVLTASVKEKKEAQPITVVTTTFSHDEAIKIMSKYMENEREKLQERNSYYVSNILVLAKAVVSGEIEYHTALECSELLADGNPEWQEENQKHLNNELKLANGNMAYFKNKYTFKSRFKDTQNKVTTTAFGTNETIRIDLDENGKPYKTLTNYEKMARTLMYIAFNEFTQEIDVNDGWTLKQLDNRTIEFLRMQIDQVFKVKIGKEDLKTVIINASNYNKYHPVKNTITARLWDGVPRAETFFIRHLGVADTFYHRELSRKWLLACVNRIFNPGCKFDEMIILQGGQGIGKSTSLEMLSMGYFVKLTGKIDPKETALKTLKSWLIEVEELASFKGTSQEILKGWVGSRVDNMRIPYETSYKDVPRQFCILGTTNEREFLSDRTGNRRYWVLKCADKIEEIKEPIFNVNSEYILQIWAEVYSWYLSNESLVPSRETLKEMEKIHGDYIEYDELNEEIEKLLSSEFPTDWIEIYYNIAGGKYNIRLYAVDMMNKGESSQYLNKEKALIQNITAKEINFLINNEDFGQGLGQNKNMKKINKYMQNNDSFYYSENIKRGKRRMRGYKRK